MSRKSVFFTAASALLVFGGGGTLALLVFHEPSFYLRAVPDPGVERKQRSGRFIQEFVRFTQDVRHYAEWSATFDEACINSYFEEQFVQSGVAERVLPDKVSAPRIAIEPDRLRLGFRYGRGALSTVISIDMGIWLVNKEPNVIALELRGLRAGALPISAQSLLEQLSEVARQSHIDVTWYRYQGNPVALLRFQPSQDRPSIRFEQLAFGDRSIGIRGRSPDSSGSGARTAAADVATPGQPISQPRLP
jgi:hypothetical protein